MTFRPHERALVHAVTSLDRRQKDANVYRLGHYLEAVQRILDDIDAGHSPRAACCRNVNDRLLLACLSAIGEAPPTSDEAHGKFNVVRP